MHTFIQKPKANQQTTSVRSMIPDVVRFGQSREVSSLLNLQRTIGNQAALRLLQANVAQREMSTASRASPRFAQDFRRIPVFPKARTGVQPMPKISPPVDRYDQGADRVDNETIHMPDMAVAEDTSWWNRTYIADAKETIMNNTITSAPAALALGIEAKIHSLRGRGQPLPSVERAFFEPRFEHNFSQVAHTSRGGIQQNKAMFIQRTLTDNFINSALGTRPRLQRWNSYGELPQKPPATTNNPEVLPEIEPTTGSSARQSHLTTAPAWLVSDPAEWENTHFATLDVGIAIDVLDLAPRSTFNRCDEKFQWWKVAVLNGPSKGNEGWVMRAFLKEDRTQPQDVEIWKAVKRLVAAGKHWEAIDLVILEYRINTRGAVFRYNPNLSVAGKAHGEVDPMVVEIGPLAFESIAYLARVILHELEHIRQFEEGMEGDDLLEIGQFLSECVELTATGVAEFSFAKFMEEAEIASRFWYALGETPAGLAQQEKYWETFVATRKVIRARYAEADPDSRTPAHENTMRWYNVQKNPGPPPPP